MNRRQFCGRLAVLLATSSVQAVSHAAPQAPTRQVPAASAKAPVPPQTVIYALGASLWFQDLDGSAAREEKLALPADSKIESLSGSRDGQTLAFSAAETIYFYNTADKTLTPLVPKSEAQFLNPAISPDGQSVSCRAYRAAGATLCIVSRDGTERDLGPSTKEATTSRFTPDGQAIYFANGPNFLRIPTGGGEATLVVRGYYIEKFSINAQGLIMTPVPVDNSAVKPALVDEAGTITRLAFEANDFNNPTWSPGGTSVAFSRRPRYGGQANAQGLYIWKNIKTQTIIRKVSDAQSNAESGFVWR